MRILSTLLIALALSCTSFSQGSLQFSQALLVGNTLQTVPAGKVWKVTSLYGEDFSGGSCVQFGSYFYDKVLQAGYRINGNLVGVQYRVPSDCMIHYSSCTGTLVNGGQACNSTGWVDVVNNALGNVKIEVMNASMPMWLPAGTTLQTLGATTFLSVIEFNILP